MPRLIAFLIALSACAPNWTHAARASEALAIGSLACDGGTTQQFLAQSTWIETNPVLGKHPSNVALWGYLVAIAGAALGLNRVMPPKAALVLNLALVGIEAHSIAVNVGVGASLCGVGKGGPWEPT